jgi:hypothetical protein
MPFLVLRSSVPFSRMNSEMTASGSSIAPGIEGLSTSGKHG